MKAYADTGFLVSVHCLDAHTDRALVRMKTQAFPLAWTWLHELEFRNAKTTLARAAGLKVPKL